MYDRNGLELSPVSDRTMNAYKYTAVNTITKKYTAHATIFKKNNKDGYGMFNICSYKDPRDAAFIAQEFNKLYNNRVARDLKDSGDLRQIITEFLETIEIPEWKFPAEGLSVEELLGEIKYKTNYVDSAKAALIEAIKLTDTKPPAIKEVNSLVEKVGKLYEQGFSYRAAALVVIKG